MKLLIPKIRLTHNFEPEKFMWLWMKYVTGVNDKKHCTNCLRGKYGKVLSTHNAQLKCSPLLTLDEQPLGTFSAIYVCGVIKNGYPRSNYEHNLHTVIKPAEGKTDEFRFENWHLKVTNGIFESIPSEADLPQRYRNLQPQFTTCRIFRWAVCSANDNC